MKRHPLADCDNCAWNTPNHDYVPSETFGDGSLLVIGEAPGAQELKEGRPFVGPTGQLLRRVAAKLGVPLEDATLDNAVACHPRFAPGSKPEKPPLEVVKCCRPRMMGNVTEQVDTVLLLGKTAQNSFNNSKDKISEARQGPPKFIQHPSNSDKKLRIVSTFHPAACLRSADYFPSLLRDLVKLNAPPSDWQEPHIFIYAPEWIIPEDEHLLKLYRKHYDPDCMSGDVIGKDEWYSLDECIAELEILAWDMGDPNGRPPIAVDIETDSDKEKSFTHPDAWLSIAIATSSSSVMVIGGTYLDNPVVRKLLKKVLTTNRTIYHNVKFDVQVLMRLGILDEPTFTHDTMLASYVLDERPGYHGLKSLSGELLGVGDYAADTKPYVRGKYGRFGNIPKDILYKYNAYDAACTYGVGEQLIPKASKSRTYSRLLDQAKELIYIELDGIAVDMDYIDKLSVEMQDELNRLHDKLQRWVLNPASPVQIKKACERLQLTLPDTSAKTLATVLGMKGTSANAQDFLGTLLAYRKLAKLLNTYVIGAKTRSIDGRIYPTYLQHGTVFGRLSSRNPNIQNIPRGSTARRIYVPSPGNVLVQCDYSQVELRVVACESRDVYLQGVFRDPTRDIHGEVSDRLYGVGNWTKEDRVRAKVYVFGSVYGMEPYSIAQTFGIPVDQAEAEQKEFFALIPDVMAWRQEVMARVKRDQKLVTHFGRVRRFPLITKQNLKDVGKEGLAFLPQSTANDICLESMVRIRRALGLHKDSRYLGIRNIVHDSIMAECPIDMRFEIGALMQEIMVNTAAEVYSDFAPFEAKPEFGYNWGALQEMKDE